MTDLAPKTWWLDYSSPFLFRPQLLLTDFGAQWITAVIGLSLAAICPRLHHIILSLLRRIVSYFSTRLTRRKSNGGHGIRYPGDTDPLLSNNRLKGQDDSSLGIAPRVIAGVSAFVLLILFFSQAVAGVFSNDIATSRAAELQNDQCGMWQLDQRASEDARELNDAYTYGKEARAGTYAANCYGPADPVDSFGCNHFYNRSIAYAVKRDQQCPFRSHQMCAGGIFSAVAFETDLIDASVIGLNTASNHKFKRHTVCSPLNINSTYVQLEEGTESTYKYYYGNKDALKYTFDTTGDPFKWLVPVYSLDTYFSSVYPEEDYWHPVDALGHQPGSTLTIMFISSAHIYHTKRSDDPIFPALAPRYFNGRSEPVFYNDDPRARVLACVDNTQLCSTDGQSCWSMASAEGGSTPLDPAYWFTRWSLENSNIYDSIKRRLGTALLAQQKISQYFSLPLHPNQWEVEVERMFATSLARIQWDAMGIATGEDRERPDYVEVTPDEARGKLCHIWKHNTADHLNVNLVALLLVFLICGLVSLLSMDVSTLKSRSKKTDSNGEPDADGHDADVTERLESTEQPLLVVEWLLRYIYKTLVWVGNCLRQVVSKILACTAHCFPKTRGRDQGHTRLTG